MNDLMAVATIRRLLVQLGYTMSPEEPNGLIGPLTLWIALPREDLSGQTPHAALAEPEGEARVSEVLRRMLEQKGIKP